MYTKKQYKILSALARRAHSPLALATSCLFNGKARGLGRVMLPRVAPDRMILATRCWRFAQADSGLSDLHRNGFAGIVGAMMMQLLFPDDFARHGIDMFGVTVDSGLALVPDTVASGTAWATAHLGHATASPVYAAWFSLQALDCYRLSKDPRELADHLAAIAQAA